MDLLIIVIVLLLLFGGGGGLYWGMVRAGALVRSACLSSCW